MNGFDLQRTSYFRNFAGISTIVMIKEFENLKEADVELLLDAPIYVTILIAGADGNIDNKERKEAIDTAKSKQSRAREQLLEYYQVVWDRFEDRFNGLIASLPDDVEERNSTITKELRKLNFIFQKVDKNFAVKLHASLKDLAKRIAEASGGIMGYLSVSYEEQKLMDLKMIQDPAKK